MQKDRLYQYVGDGEGIPGLPHVISLSEAQAQGVMEILEQAIQANVYVEMRPDEPQED